MLFKSILVVLVNLLLHTGCSNVTPSKVVTLASSTSQNDTANKSSINATLASLASSIQNLTANNSSGEATPASSATSSQNLTANTSPVENTEELPAVQRLYIVTNEKVKRSDKVFDGYDAQISGIFPFYEKDSDDINVHKGVLMYLAFYYITDLVVRPNHNKSYNIDFKRGLVLNYVSKTQFMEAVKKIQNLEFEGDKLYYAHIGSSTNAFPYYHSMSMGLSHGRLFSYSASSTFYDTYECYGYEMLKAPPSDYFRLQALMSIFEHYDWNFIGFVVSPGIDGYHDYNVFVKMLEDKNICHLSPMIVGNNNMETDIIAPEDLENLKKVKLLVFFTSDYDARAVLQSLHAKYLQLKHLFVYGTPNNIDLRMGNEELLKGSLSIDYDLPEDEDFKKFVLEDLTLESSDDDMFVLLALEKLYKCNVHRLKTIDASKLYGTIVRRKYFNKSCNEPMLRFRENIGYYRHTPVQYVFRSVLGAYHYLIDYIIKNCKDENACHGDGSDFHAKMLMVVRTDFCSNPSNFDQDLYPYEYDKKNILRTNNADNIVSYNIFKFIQTNESGYENKIIGKWTLEFLRSSKTRESRLKNGKVIFRMFDDFDNTTFKKAGQCPRSCPKNRVTHFSSIPDIRKCCVDCMECSTREIFVNNTCANCSYDEFSDRKNNTCVKLPIKRITEFTNYVTGLLACSSSGLILVTVIIAYFRKYNDSKVIRAAGREMCYSIFISCVFLFIYPAVYYMDPNNLTCFLRDVIPLLAHVGCCVAIMLKTVRIYRILVYRKHRMSPPLTSPKSLVYSLLLSYIAALAFYSLFYFAGSGHGPYVHLSKDKKFVTMHCAFMYSNVNKVVVNVVTLPIIFTGISLIVSVLSRNCPKNFNEARRITAYSIFNVVIILACVGLSLDNQKDMYLAEMTLISFYVAFAFLTLLVLFLPIISSAIHDKKYKRQDSISSASLSRSRTSSNAHSKRLESVTSDGATAE